jgi:hypothetical protein
MGCRRLGQGSKRERSNAVLDFLLKWYQKCGRGQAPEPCPLGKVYSEYNKIKMKGIYNMKKETIYLKILSCFHYLIAIIAVLTYSAPISFLIMSISIIYKAIFNGISDAIIPNEAYISMGIVLFLISANIILLGVTFSICIGISGYYLDQKRHYKYCLIISIITCIFIPVGTILGIITLFSIRNKNIRILFT